MAGDAMGPFSRPGKRENRALAIHQGPKVPGLQCWQFLYIHCQIVAILPFKTS